MNTNLEHCIAILTKRTAIDFIGPDAKTFLQGQITCNLNLLQTHQSTLGAYCNSKGSVICVFTLIDLTDGVPHYRLYLPTAMSDMTLRTFKKYAVFSKVDVTLVQDRTQVGLFADVIPASLEKFVIRKCTGSTPRYELDMPTDALPRYTTVNETVWERCEIQDGLPEIVPETTEKFLAHYLNLAKLGALHFDKGCYLGQEVIARMQFRGSIKKHMYLAQTSRPAKIKPGDEIMSASKAEPVGTIVRCTESDTHELQQLLVILSDEFSDFANIYLNSDEQVQLNKLELPYSAI